MIPKLLKGRPYTTPWVVVVVVVVVVGAHFQQQPQKKIIYNQGVDIVEESIWPHWLFLLLVQSVECQQQYIDSSGKSVQE